ncbi:MAG: DUF2064 domain-containing protein [Candidatus Omnitrophica bacterium]|nr:DUF2064 domain-containing protein [Candidatus Omnitrophota bacterium]
MLINKRKENVVVIFAKKPEIGKVKTRIAEETSARFAYDFSRACINDLINKINNSDYYDLIVAVDNPDALSWFQKNFGLEGIIIKEEQNKANKKLSDQERQSSKFKEIFSLLLDRNKYNYQKVILIPMDVPFISEEDLITAFARLNQKKFVYGPEGNGGVYLIGIKTPFKNDIFKGVRWSTSYCFNDLLKKSGRENAFSLKLKYDLNLPEDILRLRDEIYHNCPILYDFLERNGYYFSVKNRYVNFDDLSICIPVVSVIVQRQGKREIEILVQTRYKPLMDKKNTGKLEIISGLIKRYELAQDAAIREVQEETGIIAEISDEQKVLGFTSLKNGDVIAIYKPFYCHQQLKGGRAYISMAFIANYKKGKIIENPRENRNPRWIPVSKLKKIVEQKPEKVFGLILPILKEYFK